MWKKVFDCQLKLLRRDWFMRLFVVAVIVIIPVGQFVCMWYLHYRTRVAALPSFIPLLNSIFYDYLQSLFIILIAYPVAMRDDTKRSSEMIYTRPVSNVGYLWGKTGAYFLFFVSLNVFILLVGMGTHLYMGYSSVSPWVYLFYLVTFTLPSLCFWFGFTSLVGSLFRNRGGVLIVLLCWAVSCLYLPDVLHGVFDYSANKVPSLFSNVVGNPFIKEYLLHRSCYLFVGVGCWCLSVLRFGRLENDLKISPRLLFVGCACLLTGIYFGWSYQRHYTRIDERRENYREVYAKYGDHDRVRVSDHEIECRQVKDSLYAESRMMLRNASGKLVPEIVLYLNPWLTVTALTDEKEGLSFTRDQQVLTVHRPLMPGEEMMLTLSYSGKIDGAFCYLDLDDKAYYQREWPFPFTYLDWFLRVGQAYVFLSPDYTLLYPDCLWYPSTVPPENLQVAGGCDCEFTRYTLGVQKKEGMTIVSQGRREEVGDRVVFRNEDNLSGISLCIGDFHRLGLETDTLDVELYHFRKHEFFLAGINLVGGTYNDVLEHNLDFWKREYRRNYLFNEFKAIETPVCFASHQRKGYSSNNYLQPGMLFWPEAGVTLSELYFNDEISVGSVSTTLYQLMLENMYNIRPLFDEFTGKLTDDRYPGIDYLFNEIMRMGELKHDVGNENIVLVEACVDYLSRKSLREAITDKQVTKEEFNGMIRLSAAYLDAYLGACCGEGTLISFYREFCNRHLFQCMDFDLFCSEFQERTGVDIENLVEELYTRKQLPRFRVADVRKNSIQSSFVSGRKEILWSFKVYNDSDAEGVISVDWFSNSSEWGVRRQYHSYLIKARECKEIRMMNWDREYARFYTHFSLNLPLVFEKNAENDMYMDKDVGVFDCDTSYFASNPDEIIVDEMDEGFRLGQPAMKFRLPEFLHKEKVKDYTIMDIGLYPQRWTHIYRDPFYGFPRQGAWCKMVGDGGSHAEWQARLPQAGMYEVSVYIPQLHEFGQERFPEGIMFFYTVYHANGQSEIPLVLTDNPDHWYSLGEYRFEQDVAKVELSDRTKSELFDEKQEAWIVADAVKWKRVKE